MYAQTVTACAGANVALQNFTKASLHPAAPQESALEDEGLGSQPVTMTQGPGIVIECWRTASKPLETIQSLLVTLCTTV